MDTRIEFRCNRTMLRPFIEVRARDGAGAGNAFMQPAVFKEELRVHAPIEPAMVLTLESAQQLMDELWSCGIRPAEAAGSAGAMAAVQAHLQDMRRLLFDDNRVIISGRPTKINLDRPEGE